MSDGTVSFGSLGHGRENVALAARPRGGDWLEDDIRDWKRAGIQSILSLLTPDENQELGLKRNGREVQRQGLEFFSFPIPDLQVPGSEAKLG